MTRDLVCTENDRRRPREVETDHAVAAVKSSLEMCGCALHQNRKGVAQQRYSAILMVGRRDGLTMSEGFCIFKGLGQGVPRLPEPAVQATDLMKMSTEMKILQTGSAIIQPYWCIRMEEIMTPTLPSVSAMTCSRTPRQKFVACGVNREGLRNGRVAFFLADHRWTCPLPLTVQNQRSLLCVFFLAVTMAMTVAVAVTVRFFIVTVSIPVSVSMPICAGVCG